MMDQATPLHREFARALRSGDIDLAEGLARVLEGIEPDDDDREEPWCWCGADDCGGRCR